MFELKVVTHFAAAHQLKMVGEKCENLHGHNWKVEVIVVGDKLNDAGILMDFGDVKKQLAAVTATLDHKFLNELDGFRDDNPSSEKIAVYIAESLQTRIGPFGVRVGRVTAWESDNAGATYIPSC